MSEPLVSISCITYNHVNYIRDAIEGFLMQKTTFSFEIIIHDDASTDGTDQIIKEYELKYPNLIFPTYQSENQFSKGVRRILATFVFPKCRGKYIALCEGDDYWTDPNKLQKQVDFMENNLKYSFIHHNVFLSDAFSNIIKDAYFDSFPSTFDFKYLISNTHPRTVSVLFRNNCVWLDPMMNHELPPRDTSLFFLLASHGAGYYLNECMAAYRIYEGGIWSSLGSTEKLETIIALKKIYMHYFSNLGYKLSFKHSIYEHQHDLTFVLSREGNFVSFIKAWTTLLLDSCILRKNPNNYIIPLLVFIKHRLLLPYTKYHLFTKKFNIFSK